MHKRYNILSLKITEQQSNLKVTSTLSQLQNSVSSIRIPSFEVAEHRKASAETINVRLNGSMVLVVLERRFAGRP